MAFSWFPKKPPINVEANDFAFKKWFQDVYRFMKGNSTSATSSTAAVTVSENFFYPVNATGGAVIITLPLASTYAGKTYLVKKTDASANTVSVQTSAGDAIEGGVVVILTTQYDYVELYSDGIITWWKISSVIGGGSVVGGEGDLTRGKAIDMFNLATFL